MDGLKFEWHAAKAALNERKHGVTFQEAEAVWKDLNRIDEDDLDHSGVHESRSIVIGYSHRLRMLFVVYTQRYEVIRIISARRANRSETERYFFDR